MIRRSMHAGRPGRGRPLELATAFAQAPGPVTVIRNATVLTVTKGTIEKGTIVDP